MLVVFVKTVILSEVTEILFSIFRQRFSGTNKKVKNLLFWYAMLLL